MRRRVFAVEQQQAAKSDHALAIQIEFSDGRAACRGQADEVKLVGTPGEMFVPVVPARMKERNHSARRGIKAASFVGFGTVASLTGQGEVVFFACPTLTFRLDMFDGM